MALVNCPECRREVLDRAPACPQCGCPVGAPAARSPDEPPVQRSHAHISHQEVGTFGKSFGNTAGRGLGCAATIGIVWGALILLALIATLVKR
jgi:hypothetical protein